MNKDHIANMPPNAMSGMNKDHIANMPPKAMEGMNKDHIANMPPTAFAGLTAEHITNMPPESRAGLTASHMANTPPDAMAGLTLAHIANTPPESVRGLTHEHLKYIPKELLSSVTPEQLSMAPYDSFRGLTAEHVQYYTQHIDMEKYLQASGYDKARVLANLNPDEISFDDLKPVIPSGWKIETGGIMKPTANSVLALPFKGQPDSLPEGLKMPELSDLSKGFGLGGMSPVSTLQEIEQGLTAAQLPESNLTQDDNGILNVKGTGEYAGAHLAFIPDNRGMRQGPEGTVPGLTLSKDGKYVIISPNEREIPIIPAPKDPKGVLNVLSDGSEVEMKENGNVLLNMGDETLSSLFDPLVQSGSDRAKGFHRLHKTHGVLVYEDGTFQNVNAAFHSLEGFLEAIANLPGITEVEPNAVNGMVRIKYNGAPIRLTPWFVVEKMEESGPKIEAIEDSAESDGIELIFVDESGNAQIFSAIEE